MILITGATGFIGTAILRALNQQGIHDILIMDIVPPEARSGMLNKCQYNEFIDYVDFLPFLQSAAGAKLEYIIHMGAISSTTEKSWEKLVTHNIILSQKLFQHATENQ